MTQNEFVRFYSEELGMSLTQARKEIDNFMTAFKKATYNNGSVVLRGFIKSEVKEIPEKESTNPRTKEPIVVPAKTIVKVKALKNFRNLED